jgi:hypothetical protein
MSDHGFYDYDDPDNYNPFNFDNFCHIRFAAAKADTVNLPKSNVNFFRYVFNTAYGQRLPYLPDTTVFVNEDKTILR